MFGPSARPYLTTRELLPENQETPLHFMNMEEIPEHFFYRRNHFAYPTLKNESFSLHILGEVFQSRMLDYRLIRSMPSKSIPVILECAGNKRSLFQPKTYGEQWEKGAIGQGVWTGVPLFSLLELAGLKPTAREVVVEGWDEGQRSDMPGNCPYARSLPLNKAMHHETLIAYAYNGRLLTHRHGFPLRLIVPHWYAMASVKWVRRIIVTAHPFQGPFQSVDYQFYPYKDSDEGKYPVTVLNVNSSIQRPLDRAVLRKGKHRIQGIAWTGLGEINRVQLSFDGGKSWVGTEMGKRQFLPNSLVQFRYDWEVNRTGEHSIISRSEDTFGRRQPLKAFWNRKGYGFNAADRVTVNIE